MCFRFGTISGLQIGLLVVKRGVGSKGKKGGECESDRVGRLDEGNEGKIMVDLCEMCCSRLLLVTFIMFLMQMNKDWFVS